MSDIVQDDITTAGSNRAFGDALRAAHDRSQTLANYQVILCDIDGFHQMNMAFGFSAADDILAHVATRLQATVPDGAIVCRLSVDEFGIFLPPNDTPVMATATALQNAMFIAGAPHAGTVSLSIGVAEGRERDDTMELVRRAGAALYIARQKKPGHIVDAADITYVYGVAEQEELAVRTALRLGEYVPYYLPVFELDKRYPIGVEMLVRWQLPDLTLRSPALFLPIVQRSGLAAEFGSHLFVQACHEWVNELRDGFGPVVDDVPVLAVNVDAGQTMQEGFAALLIHLLSRTGLAPQEVIVEVTERVFESPQVLTQLDTLRQAGVRVSLDDFGLGSVMLAQLTTLPIDWIKVDQELVAGLDALNPDVSLIQDIKQLATLLGVGIAVEGISTETLLGRLVELGINVGQGFLFGQPDAARNIRSWLGQSQLA